MGAMNDLLDAAVVERLADQLAAAAAYDGGPGDWPRLRSAVDTLRATASDDLGLRQRTDLVGEAIVADLPGYPTLAGVVRRALADESFTGWALWPVGEAAVTAALADGGSAVFDDCLRLLAELTPRMTSEFAVRRLLVADLDRGLGAARAWARDPDPAVRRLASEGTRPLLPWAIRVPGIVAEPAAAAEVLELLHADPDEVVRRSVANHVNDISRLDPERAVELAGRWADESATAQRLVKHALRTLVKQAHPGALAALGIGPVSVEVGVIRLVSGRVMLPGHIDFAADIVNTGSEPAGLVVDYVIHFVKANGRASPKVFKLTRAVVAPGETLRVSRRHAVHQMTTRVHHPGVHVVELQVNGVRYGRAEVELAL